MTKVATRTITLGLLENTLKNNPEAVKLSYLKDLGGIIQNIREAGSQKKSCNCGGNKSGVTNFDRILHTKFNEIKQRILTMNSADLQLLKDVLQTELIRVEFQSPDGTRNSKII